MPIDYEQYAREQFLKYDYTRRGKKIAEAAAEKVKAGAIAGCAPVGYKNTGASHQIVIDKDMAPLVREAFRLAALKNSSLEKILNILTSKGLRSRNGKILGKSGLRLILTNPFYTGAIHFHGKVLPGNHPALVSNQLFEAVQESLARRRRG